MNEVEAQRENVKTVAEVWKSWKMLQNNLRANIGFDTTENEPWKNWCHFCKIAIPPSLEPNLHDWWLNAELESLNSTNLSWFLK